MPPRTSPTVDDIVAGGNLAASMAYGDVTIAGVGTVTSVCDDRVVGFGHPAAWAGETTLGLHPADAIHIQDDIIAGFKVANLGGPVGTITQDRLAGITGDLGELPETADIDVTVTQGDTSRTGVSHVPLRLPDPLAIDRVLRTDRQPPGRRRRPGHRHRGPGLDDHRHRG